MTYYVTSVNGETVTVFEARTVEQTRCVVIRSGDEKPIMLGFTQAAAVAHALRAITDEQTTY